LWVSYTKKYPYAEGIQFVEITNILREIFYYRGSIQNAPS